MKVKSILPIFVCSLMLVAADADARGGFGGGRGFSSGRSYRAPSAPRVVRRAPAPAPVAPAPATKKAAPPATKSAPDDDKSSFFGSAFFGGAVGSFLGGLFHDAVTDNESGAVKQPQNPCYPYEPNCSPTTTEINK